MADRLHLPPRDRSTLERLLQDHLPDIEAWADGSRVNGRSHEDSDLDLALRAPGRAEIPVQQLADFKAALCESTIPFPVKARDWARLPDGFRSELERNHVALQSRKPRARDAWSDAPLGRVVTFLSGGTPSKRDPAYWGGSIPWVSAKDMKRFRLSDTQDHVTSEGVSNGTRVVPKGTVLLLARGMTLLNSVPVCLLTCDMAFNQDIKALLAGPRVLPTFLPYLILGNAHRLRRLVDLAGHGTGRLNADELKALDVRLPPKNEQHAIADILGALDDKIELNRRMNETLEAMARALFKSWFVDFEPVRAKMNGRDPGLPEHVADLFPAETFETDFGDAPEGWRRGTLRSIIDLNPESWSSKTPPDRVTYVDLKNTKWGRIERRESYAWDNAPSRARRVLRRGDTIVGTVRPGNGSYALIDEEGLTGSTGFAVLRPLAPSDREVVWCAGTSDDWRIWPTVEPIPPFAPKLWRERPWRWRPVSFGERFPRPWRHCWTRPAAFGESPSASPGFATPSSPNSSLAKSASWTPRKPSRPSHDLRIGRRHSMEPKTRAAELPVAENTRSIKEAGDPHARRFPGRTKCLASAI